MVSGEPDCHWNNDPSHLQVLKKTDTGQRSEPFRPNIILAPFQAWLVLNCLMVREIMKGIGTESTAKLLIERWDAGLQLSSDGTVIFPERQKPRKAEVQADQSIKLSEDGD